MGGPTVRRSTRFDDIALIDAHCHSFVFDDAAANGLAAIFNLSDEPPVASHLESTVLMRRVVRELAAVLDCAPTYEAVSRARREALDRDADRYAAGLFRDANVELLLCDTGHPLGDDARPAVDIQDFAVRIDRKCLNVVRVEAIARVLLAHDVSFDEWLQQMHGTVDAAVRQGAVGLKTVIAYYSGLDVEVVGTSEAARSYDAVRGTPDRLATQKALCDFLFLFGIEKAIEHAIPLQVHTGMGDGPEFDLTLARPALLRRILFDPGLRRATIVLTHAGYPWVEESGWLANQYTNVHVDLSEMAPFAAHGMESKLRGLLELAPTTKLMYGSDGFNGPEVHWFAARSIRSSLALALERLGTEGWLDGQDIEQIGRSVLRENAIRTYRLAVAQVAARGPLEDSRQEVAIDG
jgi:hypothetical protein